MADTLRACIFNAGADTSPPFREPFEQAPGVEIVQETREWDQLRGWVKDGGFDLVVINLDDADATGQNVVQQLARFAPGTSILGVSQHTDPAFIIGAMRAGCSQYVTWPIDAADLTDAIQRIAASKQTAVHTSKRICVIGSSGGAGTTTIACNLAMEFGHISERRVALVDLNLEFGDVGCAFDCAPQYTIADICRDDVDIDHDVLETAVHNLDDDVALITRPESIEHAREVSPEGVQRMLEVMAELYPFVVVDLPRSFSFFSAAAVGQSDKVLIVTQLSVASIRNATRVLQLLRQLGTPDDHIEVIINRYKASYERIGTEEVASHFKRPVFATVPNDYRHVQSSLDLGQPVMTDAPNSPARLAIQEMARKIAGLTPEEKAAEPAGTSAGIFGKFWKRSGNG
jgi:pilus assembly protein CpaE